MKPAPCTVLETLYPFIGRLQEMVEECLESESRVLIAVSGNKGVGKTRFAHHVRKMGLGGLGSKDIAVIDDHVMSVPAMVFFTRRVRRQPDGVDDLKPFLPHLLRKRVVLYVNSAPHRRISSASIVLRLYTDEEQRLERLKKRYGPEGALERFHKSSAYDRTVSIPHRFSLEGYISDHSWKCPAWCGLFPCKLFKKPLCKVLDHS